MPIKKSVSEEEHGKLSEDLKKVYKKDGNDYVLDLESSAEESDEQANATRRLEDQAKKARREAQEAIKRAENAEKERDEAKQLAEDGEKKTASNSSEMRSLRSELEAVKGQLDGERQRADTLAMDRMMRSVATANGVAPSAVDDVLSRAERHGFRVNKERNQIEPVDDTTPEEWIGSLKESAPHLFGVPSGSGDPSSGGSGVDPSKVIKIKDGDLEEVANNIEAIYKGEKTVE